MINNVETKMVIIIVLINCKSVLRSFETKESLEQYFLMGICSLNDASACYSDFE